MKNDFNMFTTVNEDLYKPSEKIKIPKRLKLFWRYTWIYFSLAFVFLMTLLLIPSTPSKPVEYIYIYGIPFSKIIPTAFVIFLGFAWVFHGVGFKLIEVNK